MPPPPDQSLDPGRAPAPFADALHVPWHRHDAGAGLVLCWHDTAALATAACAASPGTTALITYHLPQAPATLGEMVFSAASAPQRPTAPQAAILLDTTATGQLLADLLSPATPRLRAALRDPAGLPLTLTGAARFAVDAIRRCPFRGSFRQLALTARTHDLVLAFVAAIPAAAEPAVPALLNNVVERIRAAAAVLDAEYEQPPSLAALAQRVGLSETSLKRGFPRVFDATVFGYLRERRLERARALLQSGEATVLEAAARVGYSNPSNFAAAFRARFGVNPKTYQLSARQ